MASHIRVGSIVTDCVKFDEMMAFWREALHYRPREPPSSGWVVLTDPDGRGPNLSFNRVKKKAPGRNNLHLDLYSDDREPEVERLVVLGARRHRQAYDPDDDFRVLEDPDGNLFCVVQLPEARSSAA